MVGLDGSRSLLVFENFTAGHEVAGTIARGLEKSLELVGHRD